MADSGSKAGLDELVKSITNSIKMTDDVLNTIGDNYATSLKSAGEAMAELNKNIGYSPKMLENQLKLQQAMNEKTIATIKNLLPKDD